MFRFQALTITSTSWSSRSPSTTWSFIFARQFCRRISALTPLPPAPCPLNLASLYAVNPVAVSGWHAHGRGCPGIHLPSRRVHPTGRSREGIRREAHGSTAQNVHGDKRRARHLPTQILAPGGLHFTLLSPMRGGSLLATRASGWNSARGESPDALASVSRGTRATHLCERKPRRDAACDWPTASPGYPSKRMPELRARARRQETTRSRGWQEDCRPLSGAQDKRKRRFSQALICVLQFPDTLTPRHGSGGTP
jgi:hypothetical protein